MIPVASCHWKIYLNFFHLIFSYERETVFGCRAIPPAFARRLFCCPIKGQKQVMDVEISTDRGKLWGCWLWYQFSPTRGKKGRKKITPAPHWFFMEISPSLRSGLWFLPDYHIPLPPKWSPALFQLRMMVSLLLLQAQGKIPFCYSTGAEWQLPAENNPNTPLPVNTPE